MPAIESMIVAINKTTDNISSLKQDHDQREALHDSRYHESQKSFMESQKSFHESQKSGQGIMSNMTERLDDLHRHIESVENKYPPLSLLQRHFHQETWNLLTLNHQFNIRTHGIPSVPVLRHQTISNR